MVLIVDTKYLKKQSNSSEVSRISHWDRQTDRQTGYSSTEFEKSRKLWQPLGT